MENHSVRIYLLLLWFTGFIAQLEAQGSTISPIRHSLHPGGRQSFDGSLPNGGCTSVNDDGDICNLQDGGTSVLVDNTILPLNLQEDNWARDLYTVNRTTSFISIGFDFGTSVRVRRVEVVLYNCQARSLIVRSIEIYVDVATALFPLPNPTSADVRVGLKQLPAQHDDRFCVNLYRVCVPLDLSGVNNHTMTYYIVFPNASGSNRVYLAETIFYTDTNICGPDALITEPVTPGPVTTTTEGTPEMKATTPTETTTQSSNDDSHTSTPMMLAETTTQSSNDDSHTSTPMMLAETTTQSSNDDPHTSTPMMLTETTTQSSNDDPHTSTPMMLTETTTQSSNDDPHTSTPMMLTETTTQSSNDDPHTSTPMMLTETTTQSSNDDPHTSTPMMLTETTTQSNYVCNNTPIASLIAAVFTTTLLATIIIVALHIPLYVRYRRLLTSTKVSKETAAPADHEEATYEQIDETKHDAFLELRQNEAYGTARVTG